MKKSMILIFEIFIALIIFSFSVSADVYVLFREGNNFTSASGQYATASHCVSGQTCSWISGNQIILGVYYSNPSTWTGSSIRWDFSISSLDEIESVELIIEWPNLEGKGLHSPYAYQPGQGEGFVAIGSLDNIIDELRTNITRCQPTNDYYAHPCTTTSLGYNIPINLIKNITSVYISTTKYTLWDIAKISLVIYTKKKIEGDVNGDCVVNIFDLARVGLNYGKIC